MARVWNFQHSTSAPYHQQANGKAEAAVKIAKRLIRKAEETGQDLWYVLLHWRNIPNHIGSSPVCRLFSRSTRCGVPAVEEKYFPRVVPFVPETILENKRKAKYYYDRKSRSLPSLQVGKPVLVQLDPDNSKTWSPAVVAQKMTDRSYVVDRHIAGMPSISNRVMNLLQAFRSSTVQLLLLRPMKVGSKIVLREKI